MATATDKPATEASTSSEKVETPGERIGCIIAAARRREDSLRTYLRPQLHPWYWGLGVAGLGLAQHVLTLAIEAAPYASAPVLAGVCLAAGWALRKRLARGWDRFDLAADWVAREPGHARVCTWAATVWLLALHLAHPETLQGAATALALGVLTLAACAARFWRHHRPEPALDAAAEGGQDSGPAPPPGEHPLARQWRQRIGSSRGCLPGSRLVDIVEEPFGIAATLALDPIRHDIDSARAEIRRISSGMDITKNNIILEEVEPTPDNPNPKPSRPTIRLVTAPAITKPVLLDAPVGYWQGATYRIGLGPYTDGDGQAEYTLYTENSMWGGFLAGATGTGKSNLVDLIATGAWNSGVTKIIFLDPKNGGSSPRIKARADWYVGNDPEMWDAVLDGLIELIEARGAENADELGTSGFTPTPQRPGLLVIAEESHNVVTKANADRWARVAREGRAAGVAALMASQIYGLESFGGNDAVRDNVTAGNTIALRVGANQSSMIKDVPLQPWRLPKIRGMAMIDEGREAVFRAAHAPPADKLDGHPEATVSMDQIMDTAVASSPPAFDTLAEGALDEGTGGVYLRRHEVAVQAQSQTRARLNALRERARNNGGASTTTSTAPAPTPAATVTGTEVDPATLPVIDLSTIAEPTSEVEDQRLRTDQAVLQALAQGEMRRADLDRLVRQDCGASRSSIHRALTRLRRRGLVAESQDWGTWRRCDT